MAHVAYATPSATETSVAVSLPLRLPLHEHQSSRVPSFQRSLGDGEGPTRAAVSFRRLHKNSNISSTGSAHPVESPLMPSVPETRHAGRFHSRNALTLQFANTDVEADYCEFQYVTSGFYGGKLYLLLALIIVLVSFLVFHEGGPTANMFTETWWIPLNIAGVVNFLNLIFAFVPALRAYREIMFLLVIFTHWPAYTMLVMFAKRPQAYNYGYLTGCYFFCTFAAQPRFTRIFPFLTVVPLGTLILTTATQPEYFKTHDAMEVVWWLLLLVPLLLLRQFELRSRRAFVDTQLATEAIHQIESRIAVTQSMVATFFPPTPTLDLLAASPPLGRQGSHAAVDSPPSPLLCKPYPDVVLIVTDLAGFTAWTAVTEPDVVIQSLSRMFVAIDGVAAAYAVEKVSTVGDSFFGAIFGEGNRKPFHLRCADAIEFSFLIHPLSGNYLRMRIGVHCGPVTGGFVGYNPPKFDLFGETVDKAKLMEHDGKPGMVHVSEAVFELTKLTGVGEINEMTALGVVLASWSDTAGVWAPDVASSHGGTAAQRIERSVLSICENVCNLSERPRRRRSLGEKGGNMPRDEALMTLSDGSAVLLTSLNASGGGIVDGPLGRLPSDLMLPNAPPPRRSEVDITKSGTPLMATDLRNSTGVSPGDGNDDGDGGAGDFHPILLQFYDKGLEEKFCLHLRRSRMTSHSLFVLTAMLGALLCGHVAMGCFDTAQDRLSAIVVLVCCVGLFVYLQNVGTDHRFNVPIMMATFGVVSVVPFFTMTSSCRPGPSSLGPFYVGQIIMLYFMLWALVPQFCLEWQLKYRFATLSVTCAAGYGMIALRRFTFRDEVVVYDLAIFVAWAAFSVVSFFADYSLRSAFSSGMKLKRLLRSAKGRSAEMAERALDVMLPSFVSTAMFEAAKHDGTDGESSSGRGGGSSYHESGVGFDDNLSSVDEEIGSRLDLKHSDMLWEYEHVVVLFVTFHLPPAKEHSTAAFELIHRTIRRLEAHAQANGMRKVKTIGTTMLCVIGISDGFSPAEMATRAVQTALSMRSAVDARMMERGWTISVGLNSGPCFGAVIGERGLVFDVFGDTINTASRMQTTATNGTVQLTAAMRATLPMQCDGFDIVPRANVFVKGKGEMEAFCVAAASGGGDVAPGASSRHPFGPLSTSLSTSASEGGF